MAASPEQVRAARAELARRELARRQSVKPASAPSDPRMAISEVAASMATSAIATPLAGLAGIGGKLRQYMPMNVMTGQTQDKGAEYTNRVMEALTYQPRTEGGQKLASAISKPFEAYERFADRAGEVTGDPSDTLGATMVKTALLAAPAVAGFRGISRAKPKTRAIQPRPEPKTKAPSIDELKEAASQAYADAENSGVFISKGSYGKFVNDLKGDLAKEGIDKKLHPKAFRAMKRIEQDANSNLTLKGAEIIRRNINDAAASIDRADRRMAMVMRDKLDEYMENLGQSDIIGEADVGSAIGSLREARTLWSRVRKAEEIESLVQKAKLSAPNFSASGLENALRTEFRNLAKNDKKMRRYTAAEQAAIRRVAQGGSVENLFRMIGKAAPTGIVSSALGSGAGLALGGPVGAVGVPLIGLAGRGGATALTRRNVSRVEDLIRRGQ